MENTILRSFVLIFIFSFSCLAQQPEGQFWRTYWYQRGAEFSNPGFATQFSVNSPEAAVNPLFSNRVEVRENGMMLIPISEDLRTIYRAELNLELWGGNPGTTNKRVTINGRSTYPIQEVGTASRNCTYHYPVIYLQPTDLVNGYNALQFACDRGQSTWGHFIVANAALRFELKRDHLEIKKAGLLGFNALIKAEAIAGNQEAIRLKVSSSDDSVIASVDYQGFYYGYDENGDTVTYGWHGGMMDKQPFAFVGTSSKYPFAADWDTRMLPEQQEIAVRAIIRFKNHPELTYETPVIGGLFASKPKGKKVALYPSRDLPAPFLSRANQKKACTIEMDVEPTRIEQAELHVVIRQGSSDNAGATFSINGQPIPAVDKNNSNLIYRKIPLDPTILKRGVNRIEILSETDHHGLEVMLPGPALMIRSK